MYLAKPQPRFREIRVRTYGFVVCAPPVYNHMVSELYVCGSTPRPVRWNCRRAELPSRVVNTALGGCVRPSSVVDFAANGLGNPVSSQRTPHRGLLFQSGTHHSVTRLLRRSSKVLVTNRRTYQSSCRGNIRGASVAEYPCLDTAFPGIALPRSTHASRLLPDDQSVPVAEDPS